VLFRLSNIIRLKHESASLSALVWRAGEGSLLSYHPIFSYYMEMDNGGSWGSLKQGLSKVLYPVDYGKIITAVTILLRYDVWLANILRWGKRWGKRWAKPALLLAPILAFPLT